MAFSNPLFFQIWRDEKINRQLLSHLDDDNLCALRLTNTACSNIVTRPLFARIHLTFTPSALSRPSRMEALARIGHHVGHLTFSMPHTESTFLPPLLNPVTGREVNCTPHTSLASETERPKYGTHELADDETVVFSHSQRHQLSRLLQISRGSHSFLSPSGTTVWNSRGKPYANPDSPRTKQMWERYESWDFPVSPDSKQLGGSLHQLTGFTRIGK